MSNFTEKVKDTASNAYEKVADAAHTVGDKIVGAKDTVVEKISGSEKDKAPAHDVNAYQWNRGAQDMAYRPGNQPDHVQFQTQNVPHNVVGQAGLHFDPAMHHAQTGQQNIPGQAGLKFEEMNYDATKNSGYTAGNAGKACHEAKDCGYQVRTSAPGVMKPDPMLS